MIQLKEMTAKGFYLLEGKASANTLTFEDKLETDFFRNLINKRLSKYLIIKEYCLKPDGWLLIVKIRDKRTIMKNYQKERSTSTSKKEGYQEVWRILSEKMRLCLSHYSRWANQKRGREGRLVKNEYKRYLFESTQEALDKIEEMRGNKVNLSQPQLRFRFDEKFYDQGNEIKQNPWAITSKMVQNGEISRQKIGLRLLYLWEPTDVVLQILIDFTKHTFFRSRKQKSTNMHQNS